MPRVIGLIALGLAATSLAACGHDASPPDTKADAPIAVTLSPVVAIETAERLEAGGVVSAPETASISSRMAATIAAVRVRTGDRVRAGDVLIALEARDAVESTAAARATAVAAEKTLAQARAERGAAEADHRLAASSRTRIAALHERHSATDQERDEAEARLAAASARLAGVDAGIEAAEARLAAAHAAVGAAAATESFTTLRAPFNGIVTERLTDPGNLAAPGTPLLRIESDGARQVVVRVDEARAAYVRPGDRVRVLIDALDRSEDGGGLDGAVAEVSRAIGADQRAFVAKVDLAPSVTARTGTFARVVFSGAARRAVVVPASAVRRAGQVSTVYVAQNGLARLRLVHLGAALPDGVEVLAGLDPGESVVLSPPARLVDGAKVTGGAS